MADLLRLAEMCEKAEGPDRELDVLIEAEIIGFDVFEREGWIIGKHRFTGAEQRLGMIDPGKHSRNFTPLAHDTPKFTASIDAAMTLILDGTDLVTFFLDVTAAMQRAGVNSRDALARFTSAAALRARATQTSPTPDIHTPNGDRG